MRAPCLRWLSWGALTAIVSLLASGIHATLASQEAYNGQSTSMMAHHGYSVDTALEADSRTLMMGGHNHYLPVDTSPGSALRRRVLTEPSFYESKNEAKSRRGRESKGKGKADTSSNRKVELKRKGYDADSEGSRGTSISPLGSPRLITIAHSPYQYYSGSGIPHLIGLPNAAHQAGRSRARAMRRGKGYAADTESKYSDGDSPSSPISRQKKDERMNQFIHAPHRPSKTRRLGNRLTRPLSPSWREIGGPSQPFG